MCAFGGLEDKIAGFGVEGTKLGDVAVELARVGSDERIAFLHLGKGISDFLKHALEPKGICIYLDFWVGLPEYRLE